MRRYVVNRPVNRRSHGKYRRFLRLRDLRHSHVSRIRHCVTRSKRVKYISCGVISSCCSCEYCGTSVLAASQQPVSATRLPEAWMRRHTCTWSHQTMEPCIKRRTQRDIRIAARPASDIVVPAANKWRASAYVSGNKQVGARACICQYDDRKLHAAVVDDRISIAFWPYLPTTRGQLE